MDPVVIGLISLPVMLILVALGIHVGIIMLLLGFVGLVLTRGIEPALQAVAFSFSPPCVLLLELLASPSTFYGRGITAVKYRKEIR